MKNPVNKPPVSIFFAATIVIFFLSLSVADSVGFVPFYIDGTESDRDASVALSNLPELGKEGQGTRDEGPEETIISVLPSHIRIPTIDLDLPVSNPASRDIETLDTILQKGPARYVDSAKLGEKGNILIFGHSSHLPVVHNQMYKAFNRIPELEAGDTITVEGGGKEFSYRVTAVKTVNAEEGIIDLSKTGNRLTIVTCDTLTSKSARFVVEAELVGSYEI
ncbi:hypothetical protein A3A38_04750 [Candidatus Kaiserbacteria bacterium RIFCSPLOWO2_01_FULL_53_17]|uniref:Sortase n=1 Tax=Candidatus Kaiserbacteria bacterium RIFCSPLOWO2_01_FULL_53_17 TaxID=1798511 RepID=A0A1F6EHP3_9BACT|nr:MAG: hypothetical protein A3A38_04750 [Candidatus Kaiserbacteria bacterium RIFCSPLOWO2_01_FULL_53_17]